jgi:FAD/FMN-containing dehydrogenase
MATSDLRQLASRLEGRLISPHDAEYETARRIWNGMIDRRPLAIARCATPDDVAAAIQFAISHSLPLAVRGGGHNVAGNALCDDGLVIDLSPMKKIQVDPQTRRVRAGGGVLWGELDAAAQQHGLATTGGLMTTTGIAGFTLGGGLGHLMRSYGLACDNLLSVEIVMADGERYVASAEGETDLFWAVRGGGGNFGVVTSFEYQLHEVGPLLLAGPLVYPLEQAREFLRLYREWTATAPDQVIAYAGLRTNDGGAPVLGVRAVYNGPPEDGERVLAPLRRFGSPLLDDIHLRPYLEIQRMVDPLFPPGRLNYWKANFLDALGDELIDLILDAFTRVPSRYSNVAFEPMGGAVARVGATETAFSHRHAAFSLLLLGGWEDPATSDANIVWARDLWEQTQPFATEGVYVNYLGTEGDDRVRAAYGPNYSRLVAAKQRYDPNNVFRLNQNIAPATT